jgi:heme exporter protein D
VQFESVAAALAMDGHGVYVWTVVAVSAAVIVAMLLMPVLSSRRQLERHRHDGEIEPEVSAPRVRIEEVNNASGS